MKKSTRAKLVCRKDMFEVMVLNADKQDKKKYFEDMGYSVSVK